MKYRLQRISRQLRVFPSIHTATFTNLSYKNLNAYLLNLEVYFFFI